jgi:hypothetical protein
MEQCAVLPNVPRRLRRVHSSSCPAVGVCDHVRCYERCTGRNESRAIGHRRARARRAHVASCRARFAVRMMHSARRTKGDRTSLCTREICARGIVSSEVGSTSDAQDATNQGRSGIVVHAYRVHTGHYAEHAQDLRAMHGTQQTKGDRASSCTHETCARGIVSSKFGASLIS